MLHLVGMEAEQEHILVAQDIMHLHIGTVQRADSQRAVHHELHVAGTAGFLAGSRDLLADLAGGHQVLSQGDPVVLQEHHLQLILADGVVFDLVCQRVDEADDALGHSVAGSSLGAEQEHMRLGDGVGVVLKLLIQGNDMQHIQKLALILVKALHLHIKDGIRVQDHTPAALGVVGKSHL